MHESQERRRVIPSVQIRPGLIVKRGDELVFDGDRRQLHRIRVITFADVGKGDIIIGADASGQQMWCEPEQVKRVISKQ